MSAEGAVIQGATDSAGQAGNSSGSENVDKIRDILFGSHMREYGQRFAQLEERLARETAEVKTEIRRRLDAMESHTRQEVEALSDRLKTERTERTESADRLLHDLSQSIKSLEKRLQQSDEQISKDLREMRQLTLDRHQSISNELSEAMAHAESATVRRLEELRSHSVNRHALADMITEIAMRLRGDFHLSNLEQHVNAGAAR